ncbi:MAG: HAD family hydrolase [Polyangiales bacterium]
MTAFLFDFNGVLVDDERVHFAAFREVLARRGVALDEKTYVERYLAFDDATAFRTMLREAGIEATAALVASCVEEKLPLYLAAVENDLVFFEGAFDLVRACEKHGDVAIVSGALRVEIELALQRASATVKTIVAAEDVEACKPDPAGYHEALRRLGVTTAIVVEDSLAGIAAARAAGCKVFGVAHSYPIDALRAAGANDVVAHIRELTVERLLG